jgi:hypothetical protein
VVAFTTVPPGTAASAAALAEESVAPLRALSPLPPLELELIRLAVPVEAAWAHSHSDPGWQGSRLR